MTKAALAAVLLWQIAQGMPQASSTWAGGTVTSSIVPNTGGKNIGSTSVPFQALYLERLTQGSYTRALTEGAATELFSLAVAQTAGSNQADALVHWSVYATDGTDTQLRRGSTYLAAVNKAGTETCGVSDVGTTAVAVSAGTLTCTSSCITGLSDVVQPALSCTSSLTQTTLAVYWRLDGMAVRTVTPQGE